MAKFNLPYSREQKQVSFSDMPRIVIPPIVTYILVTNMPILIIKLHIANKRRLYLSQRVSQLYINILFNLKQYLSHESVISTEILPQIITQYLGSILENNEWLLL